MKGKGKRRANHSKQQPTIIPTVKDFIVVFDESKLKDTHDEDYDIITRTNGTVSIYTLVKK